jgi:protein CMS1
MADAFDDDYDELVYVSDDQDGHPAPVTAPASVKKRKRRDKEKEKKAKVSSVCPMICHRRSLCSQRRKLAETVDSAIQTIADRAPTVLAAHLASLQARSFPNHSQIELSDLEVPGTFLSPSLFLAREPNHARQTLLLLIPLHGAVQGL